MKDTSKASDFIVGIAVMAVSVVFYIQANAMEKVDLGIGPGDYPKIICYVLFFLGLIQTVKTVVICRGIPLLDFKSMNGKYLLRVFIMAFLTYLYYRFVKKVGFLLLTPVYMYLSVLLFGYKNKIKGAIITVIFTTAMYFLFTIVFKVILPRGILG